MKLVIQIACFNEAETLPQTLDDLPRHVDGCDVVEVLVIDDGSTDGTAAVARVKGVDHVLRLPANRGLATAFAEGIKFAIALGADIIVNTDGDNQYRGECVGAIVAPILAGRADVVVGSRPIQEIDHFSPFKRSLQLLGSAVVRWVSGADVADAPSGFRAFSREAATRLNRFGSFTYTIETLVQAGLSNLRVRSVPIAINPPTRPSRLFRCNAIYVFRSVVTLCSTYLTYKPARVFSVLGALCGLVSVGLGLRYAVLWHFGEGAGHVQSVIAAAAMFVGMMFFMAIGVVAHLLGINRRLLEEIRVMTVLAAAEPSSRRENQSPAAEKLRRGRQERRHQHPQMNAQRPR